MIKGNTAIIYLYFLPSAGIIRFRFKGLLRVHPENSQAYASPRVLKVYRLSIKPVKNQHLQQEGYYFLKYFGYLDRNATNFSA